MQQHRKRERTENFQTHSSTVQQKQVKKRGGLGFKSMSSFFFLFFFNGYIYFWCIVMGSVLFIIRDTKKREE